VRRLFSNFAPGWPGVGLLLIRIVAGTSVILEGFQKLQAGRTIQSAILGLFTIGDGSMLIAGIWTPITGTLVVAITSWETVVRPDGLYPDILLAAMGLALALVGPGAFSIDAWIFGWKRIDLER
jgi:putative oxidoreductase